MRGGGEPKDIACRGVRELFEGNVGFAGVGEAQQEALPVRAELTFGGLVCDLYGTVEGQSEAWATMLTGLLNECVKVIEHSAEEGVGQGGIVLAIGMRRMLLLGGLALRMGARDASGGREHRRRR